MGTILSLSCHSGSLLYLSLLSVIWLSSIVLMLSGRARARSEQHAQLCQHSARSYQSFKAKFPLNMLILITFHLERCLLFINSHFTAPLHTRYSFLKSTFLANQWKNVISNDLITSAHVDICWYDRITVANTEYICFSLSLSGEALQLEV